jgi:hypothetical protein
MQKLASNSSSKGTEFRLCRPSSVTSNDFEKAKKRTTKATKDKILKNEINEEPFERKIEKKY